MKTLCAWCSKVLTEDKSANAPVSHGICSDCLKKMLGQTRLGLADFLNSIEVPVLLLDENRALRQINETAEKFMGKFVYKLDGSKLGLAIECLHVGVMGECGVSAYCGGCAFRRTIRDTHSDGLPRYGEYSQQTISAADGPKERRFRFSTSRIGDMVLVAIEGVQDL